MVRKIFRSGNSIVVSLPKELLDTMQLTEGAEVEVELDETRGLLTIAPVTLTVQSVDAAFARLVDEFIDQYRPALEALAR